MSEEVIPAFMLFPVGVWETIIDNLYDSRDIQNLFLVYPELAGEEWLKRKYPMWLFDQIIPYFHSLSDILSFRQVCQRWVHVVESYLDAEPRYRAYSPDPKRGHIQCFHLHHGRETMSSTPWEKHFYNPEDFANFKSHLAKSPSGRNPLVTRPKICLTDGGCWGLKSKSEYWNCAIDFLSTFGEHIWFLEVGMESIGPTRFRQHRLLRILSLVGNIKYLEVAISDEKPFSDCNLFSQLPPPPLPQLETLKIYGRPGPFAHFMLGAYSTQIRSLLLRHSQSKRGWEFSSCSFPNMTEFTTDHLNFPEIEHVLTSLKSPQLHSLKLEFQRRYINEQFPGNQIIAWLRQFPLIAKFELCVRGDPDLPAVDETHSTLEWKSIPTLKSFTLNGRFGGSFELAFLECFPSLEYFSLFHWNIPGYWKASHLYQSDVWERLPNLKELAYEPTKGVASFLSYASRSGYAIYWSYRKRENIKV